MELVYKINDKPSPEKILLFALQQLLAVMAATIAVPAIVGNGLSASAAKCVPESTGAAAKPANAAATAKNIVLSFMYSPFSLFS